MKKTLKDCKRFILLFYLITSILTLLPIIFLIIGLRVGDNLPFIIFPLSIPFAVVSFVLLITALIGLRLYTYNIDNHEVICFESFHVYMVVDEQVVDKAWSSSFHPPVLSHKLGNKQLEYSHRRLKVNGELVMPNR